MDWFISRREGIEPYTLPISYPDPVKNNKPTDIEIKLEADLWWVFVHEVMHGAYSIYDMEYKNGPSPDDDVWTFLYEWGWDELGSIPQSKLDVHREETEDSKKVTPIIDLTLYKKTIPRLRKLFKSYRIRYDPATGGIRLAD